MKNDIVHFNVRSSYSIGESTNRIWPLVLRARRMGMKVLGLAEIAAFFPSGTDGFYSGVH